jgi:hypothetical protein
MIELKAELRRNKLYKIGLFLCIKFPRLSEKYLGWFTFYEVYADGQITDMITVRDVFKSLKEKQ